MDGENPFSPRDPQKRTVAERIDHKVISRSGTNHMSLNPREFKAKVKDLGNAIANEHRFVRPEERAMWDGRPTMRGIAQVDWGACKQLRVDEVFQWAQEVKAEVGKVTLTLTGEVVDKMPPSMTQILTRRSRSIEAQKLWS